MSSGLATTEFFARPYGQSVIISWGVGYRSNPAAVAYMYSQLLGRDCTLARLITGVISSVVDLFRACRGLPFPHSLVLGLETSTAFLSVQMVVATVSVLGTESVWSGKAADALHSRAISPACSLDLYKGFASIRIRLSYGFRLCSLSWGNFSGPPFPTKAPVKG